MIKFYLLKKNNLSVKGVNTQKYTKRSAKLLQYRLGGNVLDNKIETVIFDMDGVVFDTEKLWQDAFQIANKMFSLSLSEEYRINTCGKNELLIRKELEKTYPNLNVDAYRGFMLQNVKSRIEAGDFNVKKHFIQLVDFLNRNGYKTGLSTSSHKDRAEKMFAVKKLDIYSCFNTIVFGEDVGVHCKPDPYIFLLTAERLGTCPKKCLVVEDSINGIEAAISGGFKAVMFEDLIPPNDFCLKNAYIIKDLNQIKRILETQ